MSHLEAKGLEFQSLTDKTPIVVGDVKEALSEIEAAIQKVIDMNVQESVDRYGVASHAEHWGCVKTLRPALAKIKTLTAAPATSPDDGKK